MGKNQITLQDTEDNIVWTLQLKTENIEVNEQIVSEKYIFTGESITDTRG
ncbi:MAG: hypothetical protein R2827_05380 [Bdellovibrionales bacterium]